MTASAPVAFGQCQHTFDLAAIGLYHVVGAAFLGKAECHIGTIDHDDFGGAQSAQNLNTDMAEAAGADADGVFTWQQMA